MARRARGGAPGDVLLKEVRAKLEKGNWPPGLTVLTGDDLYHLDQTQHALLGSLAPEEASDFALTVFDEDDVKVARVAAAARSMPMFASSRVVLVRDITVLDGDPGPLTAYAKSPPERSFLIVRALELDRRLKLHKALAQAGTLLTFASSALSAGQQLRIARQLARERNLELKQDAAAFLCDVCGGDLNRLLTELDKLRAWIGGSGVAQVSLAAVREVAVGSGTMSGWEVGEALLERDTAAATAAARRLVDRGNQPILILGGVAWRARKMLQAKAMLKRGAGRREVASAVRAGFNPQALFSGLARYEFHELLRFPSCLLEADRTLKSRAVDPRGVLESMLRKMMGPETGPNAGSR